MIMQVLLPWIGPIVRTSALVLGAGSRRYETHLSLISKNLMNFDSPYWKLEMKKIHRFTEGRGRDGLPLRCWVYLVAK